MKKTNKNSDKKRKYNKPSVEKISVDNEISIFMLTPPPDPGGKMDGDHFSINPFKISKL